MLRITPRHLRLVAARFPGPINENVACYHRSLSTTMNKNDLVFNPTPEHKALREMLRYFVETEVDPQALQYDRDEKFNVDLFRRLGSLGLLGITVDPKYGGSGMDATAAIIAAEELCSADPALCMSFLAHAILFVHNLHQNGNEEQKRRFLPDACAGKTIGGMCMSEPGAGTDVLGMSSFAVPSSDQSYFTLNGTKMWITNGTIDGTDTGDMFLVYAKTSSGRGMSDLSQFILEKGMPGFHLGQKITDKCGMRASNTAELVFTDVKVPARNLVGKVGGGALCMMRNLEIERAFAAGMSLGKTRRSIEVMSKYAQERKAFGKSIGEFGQIQKMIAETYAEYMACRHYVFNVSNCLDLNSYGNGLDADGIKLFAARMSKNACDRAMQVLGGNGYTGQYQVERLWRAAKLGEIGGGTNEAHHKNMMRDIQRYHKKIL